MTGVLNLAYSGKEKVVTDAKVDATKKNRRVRLTDQVGNVSMMLTDEQFEFIRKCNTPEGFNYLRTHEYITDTNHGRRLFPFSFEGNRIVLIYKKGKYGRLLTLGKFPEDSEAYLLKIETCNPRVLPHCFMVSSDPVHIVIPLFQPPVLPNGKPNYWSIPLINT